MTRVFLIRHGMTDVVGVRLTSRQPGIHLNDAGRRQAADLPRRIGAVSLAAIFASPLERAQETAAPLAAAFGLDVQTLDGVNEVGFGAWTGARLGELNADRAWVHYNEFRSLTPAPEGESLLAVQARAVLAVDSVRTHHEGRAIAIVSHGDVVRALVMLYLGMPIDFHHRVEIAPASISIVDLGDAAPRVTGVNLLGAVS